MTTRRFDDWDFEHLGTNCFDGGQPTNCRVNATILGEAQRGGRLDLWFSAFDGSLDDRRAAETRLIHRLSPPWNRAKLPRAPV